MKFLSYTATIHKTHLEKSPDKIEQGTEVSDTCVELHITADFDEHFSCIKYSLTSYGNAVNVPRYRHHDPNQASDSKIQLARIVCYYQFLAISYIYLPI